MQLQGFYINESFLRDGLSYLFFNLSDLEFELSFFLQQLVVGGKKIVGNVVNLSLINLNCRSIFGVKTSQLLRNSIFLAKFGIDNN